jgi:hypothetical protein
MSGSWSGESMKRHPPSLIVEPVKMREARSAP